MAYYRKLHIDEQEWQYHVGGWYVPIKGPNNESFKPTMRDFFGDFDVNDEKIRFAVTPEMVKDYILKVIK